MSGSGLLLLQASLRHVIQDTRNLTLRQLVVLVHVCIEQGNDWSVSGLAADISVPTPSVTRAIDALIEMGLVEKRTSADDLRKIVVSMTKTGRVYIARLGLRGFLRKMEPNANVEIGAFRCAERDRCAPSEMECRVGDALAARCRGIFGTTWSNDVRWAFARIAIATMRKPTEAMYARANAIEAKSKADLKHFDVTGFVGLAYQAMIDAAAKDA
jgi:DNA-binding MarR family transcriptional regulator